MGGRERAKHTDTRFAHKAARSGRIRLIQAYTADQLADDSTKACQFEWVNRIRFGQARAKTFRIMLAVVLVQSSSCSRPRVGNQRDGILKAESSRPLGWVSRDRRPEPTSTGDPGIRVIGSHGLPGLE